LRHVDLFSGIGGFALAARWAGLETIQFVELDPYCQRVLKKNFPDVPIHDDVKTLDGTQFKDIFLITGGFPCQDISIAGKGAGLDGERSGLWTELFRIISEVRPRFALVENVPALTFRGGARVIGDLAEIGYDAEWQIVGADDVGAPHRRKRIWIVAYPNSKRGWQEQVCELRGEDQTQSGDDGKQRIVADSKELHGNERREHPEQGQRQVSESGECGGSEDVAYSKEQGSQGHRRQCEGWDGSSERTAGEISGGEQGRRQFESCLGGALSDGIPTWMDEPDIPRVAKGIPDRVNRLRSIGNSIVPQVAYEIIRAITWTN